jgi:hypothetical protein
MHCSIQPPAAPSEKHARNFLRAKWALDFATVVFVVVTGVQLFK